jgi:YD repeat-containing protein
MFNSSVSGNLRSLESRSETGDARELYDYDSLGNVTETNSARGRYSAVYSDTQQPRYWETLEGATRRHYTLQWDGAGRLVRLTGVESPVVVEAGADAAAAAAAATDGAATDGAATDGAVIDGAATDGAVTDGDTADGVNIDGVDIDVRYDYTLDERGNWIERRETHMTRQLGALAPGEVKIIRRTIEYGADL